MFKIYRLVTSEYFGRYVLIVIFLFYLCIYSPRQIHFAVITVSICFVICKHYAATFLVIPVICPY